MNRNTISKSDTLAAFEGVKKVDDNQWQALCPTHDDKKASLSISFGDDGKLLLKCHAGCQFHDIAKAVDLPKSSPTNNQRRMVATYDYHDADGKQVYQVVRYEPKDFRQRRQKSDGSWLWNMQGVERVPYRLRELLADPSQSVFICEGEKDVDRLVRAGLIATCNPGGAGKWQPSFSKYLEGRQCFLIPDNDSAGRRHMDAVAESIDGVAERIRLIELDVPQKGDVSDWLDNGNTTEQLKKLAKSAPEWRAAPAQLVELTAAPGLLTASDETEIANGKRIINEHGRNLRWHTKWKCWFTWDGKRWVEDSELLAHSLAKKTLGKLLDKTSDAFKAGDNNSGNRLLKFAKASNSRNGVNSALDLARSEDGIPVTPEMLDTHGWLLNVENGTLDLNTVDIRPHRRSDLITNLAPVAYDRSARADTWRSFLTEILPNRDVMLFVQRCVGMSLVGETLDHAFLFCYGTGANGKSTFLNTIYDLMGDYAYQAPDGMLLERSKDGTKYELADLFGKRFVSTIEAGAGRRLDEPLIKALTGADRLTAQRKYKDPFSFHPTYTLWLAANHKPRIKGQDEGIWRRIYLIPFETKVSPEQQDKHLPQKLRGEMPGILNWALDGLTAWQEMGLAPPEAVRIATKDYQNDEDTLAGFIDQCCTLHPHASVESSILYEKYVGWIESQNGKPWGMKTFLAAIEERGFKRARPNRRRGFEGIDVLR